MDVVEFCLAIFCVGMAIGLSFVIPVLVFIWGLSVILPL